MDILGFGYAAIVAAGGIMGYAKAGNFALKVLSLCNGLCLIHRIVMNKILSTSLVNYQTHFVN